jgi:hypothetical protein
MSQQTYKQIVWDYNLPQEEFEAILRGEKSLGSLDQTWAIARILENLNYYDAMKLVPPEILRSNWDKVKPKLFKDSIRKGYEFVLQRQAVSAAG